MKASHWISIGIAALLALTYALVNRYEFRQSDAGFLCFDRWTGGLQLIKPVR